MVVQQQAQVPIWGCRQPDTLYSHAMILYSHAMIMLRG
jgi:hypothetical protein